MVTSYGDSLYNWRDINALSIRIFILCLVSVDETRYTEAGGRNPSDSYGPTSRPVQLDANDRNKPEGFEESGIEIMTHEMAHIKARHSIDLLISEICILFHWFNPSVWLLRQELQNIHEYEADESVLNQGVDAKRYQLLLIKKAVGAQRFTSMANSFNHSSLKKRIAMMLKQKSSPWARLKYLYVLPLAALTVVAFARPEISHELEKISSVKISEIIPVQEKKSLKEM